MRPRLGPALIRRHAAAMASAAAAHISKAPLEPLLVILGSTGTGKSELAVELATRFRGEIVNADAMQLYDGLPIITNKLPVHEQAGIRHHLLGHIPLHALPWDVEDFKREASRIITEIRKRGKLPIIVGGTHYYLDSLLFPDVILDQVQTGSAAEPLSILEEPTPVLLSRLRECDPVMADRWHPNDRRKIQRSLEIYLRTGKPASEYYAEQEERKLASAPGPWENLLIWLHCDRQALCDRLNARVDRMLGHGLVPEVQQLSRFRRRWEAMAEGHGLDMSKGIWQSIGYKQFEPYVTALDRGAPPSELEGLESKALEEMKTATRRYANYQTRWIRLKQVRRLQEQGPAAMASIYLLDSTEMALFQDHVVGPAVQLTRQFLSGEPRPAAAAISERARDILAQAFDPPPEETPRQRICDLCKTVLLTEQAWRRHINGSSHRRLEKKKKKLALVPVDDDGNGPNKPEDDEVPPSSPEIGSIFSEF